MYLSVFDESNVIMCILLLNDFATKLQNVKTNLSQYAFIIREKDIFWPQEKISTRISTWIFESFCIF